MILSEYSSYSFEQAQSIASQALQFNGTRASSAECVARALVLADADGLSSHGLDRLPSYIRHLRSGKVNGQAEPTIQHKNPSSVEVSADFGFAYPAIELAIKRVPGVSTEQGIAVAAIVQSHHCGVLGHPVEVLARKGYIAIMFANTPKAMPVAGGKTPILGTNPIAFACPRNDDEDPLIIDTSLTKVARGKIVVAAKRGESVSDDWGVDASGQPTSDPEEILNGSLNPIGGAKGAALALMVEILVGAFVGSNFGFQASSFFDDQGGSPNVGQLLICLPANEFNSNFSGQLEDLIREMQQDSTVRLPGARRLENRRKALRDGLRYPNSLLDAIHDLAT